MDGKLQTELRELKERVAELERVPLVSALEVPEGSLIVLHSDLKITSAMAAALRSQLEELFPEHPVAILAPGLTLEVVERKT